MADPMSVVGVIPPPLGRVANFVNPPDQRSRTIVLHTVCLALVTLFVTIRIYTRRFISRKLGWDDYCCLLAYALTIAFSAVLILGNAQGIGRHLWDVPAREFPNALKTLFVSELIYLPLVAIIKLSCLLFYRRVFSPNPRMKVFIDSGIYLILGVHIAIFFATLFDCVPIQKSWNVATPGRCLQPESLPYASGAINVVSDIYVLILPIPCIWGLNMSTSRKLRVISVFGLGIFACAAGIVRLGETSIIYSDLDRTWNIANISVYSVIEVNVGIICASSLAFPAFFERHGTAFISKLKSYTSFRPLGNSTGPRDAGRHSLPSVRRGDNQSGGSGPRANEYLKLDGNSKPTKMQKITRSETFTVSHEDVEAWPHDGRELVDFESIYPQPPIHGSQHV